MKSQETLKAKTRKKIFCFIIAKKGKEMPDFFLFKIV